MKSLVVFTIAWVVLALSTLYLVVQEDSTIIAALVAWAGGVITHILYVEIRAQYGQRKQRTVR